MNGLIGIEPQRLTPKQRRVQLVNNFEAEVFNGGWDQYIFNSSGNDAEEFRNLAIQLGYAGIASALSTLAHQMGGSIPKDRTKRSILLTRVKETISEAQEEQIADSIDKDIHRLLEDNWAFIQNHAEEFTRDQQRLDT